MCDCMKDGGIQLPDSPGSGMYSLSPSTIGFGAVGRPITDESNMSATVLITTSAVDRQRESILSDGIDVGSYRNNPVVLWEHGLDPEVPLPVGQSEDSTSRLLIDKSPDGWRGTCLFAQSYDKAVQIFGLVNEKVIRAASVQVIPDPAYVTRDYDNDGRPFTVVGKCELVEWSWGRMGVNPEAVRKTLSANRVGGDRLLPFFRHLLEPFSAKRKSWGVRVDLGKKRTTYGVDRYRLKIKSR